MELLNEQVDEIQKVARYNAAINSIRPTSSGSILFGLCSFAFGFGSPWNGPFRYAFFVTGTLLLISGISLYAAEPLRYRQIGSFYTME